MSRARMPSLGLALLSFACSCTAVEQVDLEEYLVDADLTLTANDAPPGASPLTVIAVHQSGFYLLGWIPFQPVRLDDCVAEVANRARQLGADGVSELRLEYTPASFMKFAAFPFPDWSATISLSGMAYRLPTNPAYPR